MKFYKSLFVIVLSLLTLAALAQNEQHSKKENPHHNKPNCSAKTHGHHGKMTPEMKSKIKAERKAFDNNLTETEKKKIDEVRLALKDFRAEMKGIDKSDLSKEDWELIGREKKKIIQPIAEMASLHKQELMAVAKRLHSGKDGFSCDSKKHNDKSVDKKKEWDKKGKAPYGDKGKWENKKKEAGAKKGECPKGKTNGHEKKEFGQHQDKMKHLAIKFLLMDPNKKKKEAPNIAIFPNPSIDRNTISFHHPTEGIIIVDLIDKEGKVLKQVINEYREAGMVELTFDVNGLNAGDMYFYRINDNGRVTSKRFIMAD